MINVELYKTRDDTLQKIKIEGHAEYAEYGKDIICAAVSVLSQSLIIGLERVLGVKIKTKIHEGYLELEYYIQDSSIIDSVDTLLLTFEYCIKEIEEQYGNYIKVKELEVLRCK